MTTRAAKAKEEEEGDQEEQEDGGKKQLEKQGHLELAEELAGTTAQKGFNCYQEKGKKSPEEFMLKRTLKGSRTLTPVNKRHNRYKFSKKRRRGGVLQQANVDLLYRESIMKNFVQLHHHDRMHRPNYTTGKKAFISKFRAIASRRIQP
ncbi:hypothetical protein RUM43_010049 [Polyplax serrata]|uniref:Uncharacterized protein n=1 Tax=Polyplax serrata TaxID=468196 RepID=A0AAN8P6Z8_POLSC